MTSDNRPAAADHRSEARYWEGGLDHRGANPVDRCAYKDRWARLCVMLSICSAASLTNW